MVKLSLDHRQIFLNPFDTKGVGPTPQSRFGPLCTLEAHYSTTVQFRTPKPSALAREFNFKKIKKKIWLAFPPKPPSGEINLV